MRPRLNYDAHDRLCRARGCALASFVTRAVGLLCVIGVTLAAVVPTSTLAAAQTPKGSITIDLISRVRFPTEPAWSLDGARVAFLWDDAGKQDLFVVMPGQEPAQLTDFPADPNALTSDIGRFAWVSPDEILFGKERQLWSVSPSSAKPVRVSGLDDAGNFVISEDRTQIAFTRERQLWVASLAAKTERQLTFLPEELSASGPVFSRDGRHVAFTAGRSWTEEEPLPYNGNIVRTFRNRSADRRVGSVSVYGGDPTWIPVAGEASDIQWTGDGNILFQEISADRKTRTIRVSTPTGVVRTLWTDYDPAWWSPTRRDARTVVSPDGRQVAFASDRTGWIHVYAMPVDAASEKEAVQLTSGRFGAGVGSWSPDSRRVAYHHSVDGNQMERFIAVVDVATRKTQAVVAEPGLSYDPVFSPDGSRLLFLRADARNSQDVYVAAASGGEKPVRLSSSMPAELAAEDFTTPKPVYFPSRVDGQQVPATLMVSPKLDLSRRHPAIVWIHGSGSDQNFLGWHPGSYRMYYGAHEYLAQQGYVILTPDYRGSSGYSRDWATGHYMDLGGADYLDVASGADYLKTLDFVDPERIAVWGLSYGGFMTLQAVTVTPTLFRCAINVAGVGDWATWSTSGWITGRMGTPVENPEGFHRSASVKHMDKLERPLLVMHGTADTNVAFRESLTLIDTLVKLGKPFETVVYPGETHFFRRGHVLRDAWRRAEAFFAGCLRS